MSTRGGRLLAAVCLLAALLAPLAPRPSSGPAIGHASPPPSAETQTFPAVADAYVYEAWPNRNFGAEADITVGRNASTGGTYRGLVAFDVSSIPWYSDVVTATLQVRPAAPGLPGSVDVHRVRAPWSEGAGLLVNERDITVSEAGGLARTRETVVVRIAIPGGTETVPERDFLLFDSLGREVPSQVLNFTAVGGTILSLDLAFESSLAAFGSETYTVRYGVPSASVPAYRSKSFTPGPLWTFPASASATPAIADLNGDGLLEVIVGTRDGRVVDLEWDGTALAMRWTYAAPGPVSQPVLAADLTGDGDLEVLVYVEGPPSNRSVTAIDGNGAHLWHARIAGGVIGPFAAMDTDADGIVEVYTGSGAAAPTFFAIRGSDGGTICTFENLFDTGSVAGMALGDVTGTPAPEVVFVDTTGHIRVRNPDCTIATVGNGRPGANSVLSTPSLANATGDGHREIILGDSGGVPSRVYLMNGADFGILARTPPMGSDLDVGQIIADADRDGIPEAYFVTAGDGALHRASLGMVPQWTFAGLGNGSSFTIPSAADLDRDGKAEILMGTDGSVVYAVSSNGSEVHRWVLGAPVRATPLSADLDGDGTLEVLLVTDNATNPSQVANVYAFGTGSLGYDTRSGSYTAANRGLWLDGNSPEGRPLLRWTVAPPIDLGIPGVTWTTRDGTSPWANPGIDFDSSPIATAPVDSSGAPVTFNVTGVVQSWVNGSLPNNGFVLRSSDESADWSVAFPSREVGGALAPVLEVTFVSDARPEIVGQVPDQVFPEDSPAWFLDLLPYASDPNTPQTRLQWAIEGVNTSLVSIQGMNVTGNHVLTFRPVPDAFGVTAATLFLFDDEGLFDNQDIVIVLTPMNDIPTFSPPGVLYVRFDRPYPFDFGPYIADIDDPVTSLQLSVQDATYATVAGHTVTFLYPSSLANQWVYEILSVSDPSGGTASQVIAVRVGSDFPPELRLSLPDITLLEGESRIGVFDLDDYFADPDQDSLFFSYGNTHVTVTISPETHSVDVSAPAEWTGRENVTFRAEDPAGAIAEDTILVTVVPVNDPPEVEVLPPLVVRYDFPYTFDVTPYLSDPDTPIEQLTLSTSNPSNVTVTGRSLVMLFPFRMGALTAPYAVPLTVTVTDGSSASFGTTTVSVVDDFPPTLGATLPDREFAEDTSLNAFDLDSYFLDVDSSNVAFTSRSRDVRVTINTDHTVVLTATTNWSGSELVTFRATDSQGAFAEDSAWIVVTPVNDAPAIQPLPKQVHEGTGTWVLDLAQYVVDSDDPLSELLVSTGGHPRVQSAGMFLVFDYSRDAVHEVVTVTVSDGALNTSVDVEVEIIVATSILPFIPIVILGVVVAIVVARRYLRINIEEVFLVHSSGLPIAHLSRSLTPERSTDTVTAMFTAIQLFAKDVFRASGAGPMRGLAMGAHRITIAHGRLVYLAVLFSSVVPFADRLVRKRAEGVVKEVESRFGDKLEAWRGLVSELDGVRQYVETLFEAKETGMLAATDSRPPRRPDPGRRGDGADPDRPGGEGTR